MCEERSFEFLITDLDKLFAYSNLISVKLYQMGTLRVLVYHN